MKNNEIYRQCRLVKRLRDGQSVQMSYLPEEFAREGRIVKLRNEQGDWDDGWVISLVGREMKSEDLHEIDVAHRRFQKETSKA